MWHFSMQLIPIGMQCFSLLSSLILQGPLSTEFPIENRNTPVTMRALRNHLDPKKNLPFVKRISDFHMLLLVARFLDVNAYVPALAQCVQTDSCTRRLPAPNRVHGQYLLICLLGLPIQWGNMSHWSSGKMLMLILTWLLNFKAILMQLLQLLLYSITQGQEFGYLLGKPIMYLKIQALHLLLPIILI